MKSILFIMAALFISASANAGTLVSKVVCEPVTWEGKNNFQAPAEAINKKIRSMKMRGYQFISAPTTMNANGHSIAICVTATKQVEI